MQTFYYIYDTHIGTISIAESGGHVVYIGNKYPENSINKRTPFLDSVFEQLCQYFDGVRTDFDIPIRLDGSDFMKKVWNQLIKIPYGQTATYKQIAIAIGKPKAARAVGNACNKNPLLIIVPCHRVIGIKGNLTGYAMGLELKEKLLNLELKKANQALKIAR